MTGRLLKCAVAAAAMVAGTTCDEMASLDLCDPTSGGLRVGFYSTGDCLGFESSVFLGHEWLTFLGNQAADDREERIFTDDQLHAIIEGNRHTDYPKELLVHLDNGVIAYLDALLAYHDNPDGQADHFLLRGDNYAWEAWQEGRCVIRKKTIDAVALWHDEQIASLTRLGQATHTLQDSYALAHVVRRDPSPAPGTSPPPECEEPANDAPWCICKIKTFMPRAPGFEVANPDPEAPDYGAEIGYHERQEEEGKPGHSVAADAIFQDGVGCLAPDGQDEVEACLMANAAAAVVATHDYLAVVRALVTTSADLEEIDRQLGEYFAAHFPLCNPPPWDRDPCPGP